MVSEIQVDIETFQRNTSLWEEVNFGSRADALDYLGFCVIDRIESLLQLSGSPPGLPALKQQAENIKSQLEAIDVALFERLRVNIRSGRCQGITLLNLINTYLKNDLSNPSVSLVIGYDNLDLFTNGLFPLQALPVITQEREPDMIYYQKTPARIILQLVANAKFTDEDVFYDLGSGLGHVCILVNLLSGANAKGIEIEPAYCTYAQVWAADLNLSRVAFICEDARTANCSDGTVFFLYTPFEGRLLHEVLDKLRVLSWHKRIRVFTYGPCTDYIARQSWLTGVAQVSNFVDQLGEFCSYPTDNQ